MVLPRERWGTQDLVTVTGVFQCSSEECQRLSIGETEANRSVANRGAILALTTAPCLTWTPASISRPDFPDVPEQIAKTASEAHACLSVQAYRGAVALARAVVESTAKAKGITNGTLIKKIDQLHADGHIRPGTREFAHEVREGGNEIAHGDLGDEEMPPEDADSIIRLMDHILREVFQDPAEMQRLRKRRLDREKRNQGK